jgi:hypothetical protein
VQLGLQQGSLAGLGNLWQPFVSVQQIAGGSIPAEYAALSVEASNLPVSVERRNL